MPLLQLSRSPLPTPLDPPPEPSAAASSHGHLPLRCPHLVRCFRLPALQSRRGVHLVPAKCRVLDSDVSAAGGGGRGKGHIVKNADIATLGNLCVDIVLNVPSLPPAAPAERKAYMERLSASPPDKKYWEAGGNCNLAIAAARLGLHCVALGHVGDEIYGHFLQDVLQEESISMVAMNEDSDVSSFYSAAYETLLCWVLVDPFQRHGFCSRADFSKEPAFSWILKLSRPVEMAIEKSKILFCNGYAFDELFPRVIISALDCAVNSGTAVFFDPGPRVKTLSNGDPDQRRALELFLRQSDVLLFTSEEVNVLDTVGCGDSFTAAVAFGFLFNMPTVNTLALANAVGAATATGCGAGRNVATLDRVLELLKLSNLNEDEESWNALLDDECDASEIVLLSRFLINGNSARIIRISSQKVASELIPKLGTMDTRRVCHLEG